MTSEERIEYAQEALKAVYGAGWEWRGSSADFDEVRRWAEEGIPLAVVLEAIQQLPKHPSVGYVAPAVRREWERVQYARRIG